MEANIEKVKEHINYFEHLTEDLDQDSAINGKNKSIRDKETSNISSAIDRFKYYLDRNKDLSELLLEYHDNNIYGYEEHFRFQYFVRDTKDFIVFLKDKIRSKQS